MDDSCAVCADTLEWVSYGACGHKEVCSTCVARLRFICEDRRCCICKTESNVVFVTKALGDYTRMINDFSVFPSEVKEGRVGPYWYHEDTQAYFDDQDQYKMIKAMCRLSCSVCDNKVEEGQPTDGPKKRPARFRNIEQLKGHLFHQHRLLMCSLCLEGRKVFICEQKLYTRAQLKQHVSTGDSEVDGTENERGGFMGHPVCEFCRTPFYGDNELYLHMSTEHYTCHICQRQHPGQYEYYKNYDDLEMHFRQEHFLCEDEACLGKKFVVFQSEAEMKRHNTLEHGGRMSRSQRSAALQIPTSFRYRRNNEQENRRGRGRMFRRDDVELSMAIQASLETSNSSAADPPLSSNGRVVGDHGESDRDRVDTSMVDPFPIIQPFESLSTTSMDSEPPSRYLQAVSQRSRTAPLQESSFPPLALGPSGGGDTSQEHDRPEAPLPKGNNTMAAHLRRQSNKRSESNVHHNNNSRTAEQLWPTPANRGPIAPLAVNSRPLPNSAPSPALSTAQTKPSTDNGSPSLSSYSSLAQSGPAPSVRNHPNAAASSSSSLRGWSSSKMTHSTSAPNLVETGGSVDNSMPDFPPVSVVQQMRKVPSTVVSTQQQQVVDVQSANKTLVERIQSALAFDQDKYTAFKDISGEYRKGLLDTVTYLAYVEQFGLSHLVPELARLLPDPRKQKELVDAYNSKLLQQNDWIMNGGAVRPREGGGVSSSNKGKGKSSAVAVAATAENINNPKNKLADDVISTVRKLQAGFKTSEEGEIESLSKDGYRAVKGKSKSVVTEPLPEEWAPLPSQPLVKLKDQNAHQLTGGVSNQNTGGGHGDGKGKQWKKTSKFHRIRLGDGSLAAHLDSRYSDPEPDSDRNENPPGEGIPVRGVWRNGGGHKLLSMTSTRDPKK